MTLVLAVATATPQISVALGEASGERMATVQVRLGQRHGEVLAPAIDYLVRTTAISLSDVELVAVDAGPGLFTGLRVGVATAKAIASAVRVPMVAGSSLDLLAQAVGHCGVPVVPMVDARRGEIFWVLSGESPRVDPPETAVRELRRRGGPFLLVGDGARRYWPALQEIAGAELADPLYDHPNASVLIRAAAGLPAMEAEKVSPTYIRGADVRIGWVERDA